jgi:hypothetical protein
MEKMNKNQLLIFGLAITFTVAYVVFRRGIVIKIFCNPHVVFQLGETGELLRYAEQLFFYTKAHVQ